MGITLFCGLGNYSYLCKMKGPTTYLKTETNILTRTQLRRVAKETLNYCISTMGINPKLPVPAVSIQYRGRSRRYGQYDVTNNKIEIFHNTCGDVKMVIRTVIHEYTHYLQDMDKYWKLYKKVGYNNHPDELEARSNEKLYSPCWKVIKNKI